MRSPAAEVSDLDLSEPAPAADPHGTGARPPVGGTRWSNSLRAWLITDHGAVARLLRSPLLVRAPERPDRDDANRSLQRVERPEHARLRATVADVFHGPAALRLRGPVGRLADELVARCASGVPVDLMAEVAHPLATGAIAQVLGIPAEDLGGLAAWSTSIAAAMGPAPWPRARAAADSARAASGAYVERMVAARARQPGDDLVSRLVTDTRLSRGEAGAMVRLLLFTGAHPTALAIGNALDLLARYPPQLEAVRHQPWLLPGAVEESLRFETVINLTSRRATADCVVGGARVRAGDQVALLLGFANRDGRVFRRADEFDVARDPGPHLAFGRGVHACLAPVVARLVVRAALDALVRQNVTLLPAGAPVRLPTPVMRGFEILPARLQRR